MELNSYQKLAKRTMAPVSTPMQQCIYAMGLAGEAGEVVDYLKKVLGHGHSVDIDHLKKELGDVLWYVSAVAESFDIELEDVGCENIVKLRKRYPEGFTHEASRNRGDS